jgi:hypothetical protein
MDRATAQLPRTTEQRAYFGLFVLFLATVFILIMALVQHQVDDQYITSDELKRSAQELESYSAEASIVSQYTVKKEAPRQYVEAYSSNLLESTDSIRQKLQEHPHNRTIAGQLQACLGLAAQLSSRLDQLSTVPRSQLGDMPAQLDNLAGKFQKLEENL